MIFIAVWVLAFVASLSFLFVSIIDYRKTKKTKIPIIITGITTFVLLLPIIIWLILLIGFSTGLVRM
ncbi:MAG: hypothetical protein LBS21_15375 [Clostridiales bacterium]|jgi:phosphatidylserine synthase|nr:hypothetical protein [Clostridiales bacterium]